MTELWMDNVSYRDILHSLSMKFQSGELIGLVGPNGAGKSTCLRLAAGLWGPTGGDVHVDGQSMRRLSIRQRARRVAYLPQSLPDDITYTVQEFIEMGRFAYHGHLHGLTPACKSAVASAMETLSLADHAGTPLAQLSGGERQRVAIARCLAQQSDILLLDEPISNLDLYYQLDILTFLRSKAQSGLLILMAIHHLEFAAQFCSRVCLLHEGRLVASGLPNEVLSEENMQRVFRTNVKTYADPLGHSLRFSYPEDSSGPLSTKAQR